MCPAAKKLLGGKISALDAIFPQTDGGRGATGFQQGLVTTGMHLLRLNAGRIVQQQPYGFMPQLQHVLGKPIGALFKIQIALAFQGADGGAAHVYARDAGMEKGL